MSEITSYLFPNHKIDYIYPIVFIRKIKEYMEEKDIYLHEFEEKVSMDIISYYDYLTSTKRYISNLERTIYELEEFLPLFAEHGYYHHKGYQLSAKCLLRMFENSLIFHNRWMFLVEKWYHSLQRHLTLGNSELSILISGIYELILFYNRTLFGYRILLPLCIPLAQGQRSLDP